MGKEEQWEKAMQEYKKADDKEGYSKAFSEYRHEIFREYFALVVLITAVLLFGFAKLFSIAAKLTRDWKNKIQMGGDM
jgi:hypothetical protein